MREKELLKKFYNNKGEINYRIFINDYENFKKENYNFNQQEEYQNDLYDEVMSEIVYIISS